MRIQPQISIMTFSCTLVFLTVSIYQRLSDHSAHKRSRCDQCLELMSSPFVLALIL